MHEHRNSASARDRFQNRFDSFILDRIPMHCGKKTDALHSAVEGLRRPRQSIRLGRIEYEESVKPLWETSHCCEY